MKPKWLPVGVAQVIILLLASVVVPPAWSFASSGL
jgi:hypothetical protein